MNSRGYLEKRREKLSSSGMNGVQETRILTLYFWSVILLGTVLRLYDLGAESYWGDEVITLRIASQSIPQIFASFRLDQPLAYYLPLSFWIKAFGTTETITRFFSALLGIAAIFLTYRVGQGLFNREVALVSAFLMAISEFQIYYSQETRPYSLFECSTLISFLLYIQALRRKKGVYFILWGVSCLLLLSSHAYGAFILVAQDMFFLLQLKKYRDIFGKWFLCQLPIFLAVLFYFVPMITNWWEPIFRSAALDHQEIPNPSLSAPLHSLYYFSLPARHARSWGSVLATYLVAGVFLAVSTWIFWGRRRKFKWLASARGLIFTLKQELYLADKLLLIFCWLLCPIVLPFFLSQVIGRMYQDRYTISAAPAFYLLLAFGIFQFRKFVPMLISLGALVIMVAPGIHNYYANNLKEQWREAAAYVQANSGANEVIVIAPVPTGGNRRISFDWYYRGNLPECEIKIPIPDDQTISTVMAGCTSGYQRFWLVLSGPNYMIEPILKFPLEQDRQEIRLIKRQQFTKIMVSLFELN